MTPGSNDEPISRDQLVKRCFSARDPDDLRATLAQLRAYIRVHPDDRGILEYGELVGMTAMASGIDPIAEGRAEAERLRNRS
jgi:hypothetical protein